MLLFNTEEIHIIISMLGSIAIVTRIRAVYYNIPYHTYIQFINYSYTYITNIRHNHEFHN